ncbi:uncharacterized protein [Lolium perenne]|uniref:uncharacterized protein n=1 Tax=Lolium perenne TaxID=4522 RepID=UPI003A9A1BE5
MIKELLRIGSQFVGYREYAARAEEKLSEANERVDALAQKLEQSEAARKKAELAASKAKAEVDEAKVKAASIEELQRRLKDAESALDEQKTAQTVREQEIIKRLKSQSRRTLTQTNQDFDLENPVNDPLLDALSLLEFHGREIREGVANASATVCATCPSCLAVRANLEFQHVFEFLSRLRKEFDPRRAQLLARGRVPLSEVGSSGSSAVALSDQDIIRGLRGLLPATGSSSSGLLVL